ncbi:hypothetical protein RCL_jg9797.t1 [Rhizophagus clarus]|uniref:Uncharacterized protein n=1 Tax=Rhizophagus clarus TaxID=94130 RepID=A0A8H3LV52_9GLOM|nr:hypothetical protein RCL_jg9797.t1 [Rhizophagus clarus]
MLIAIGMSRMKVTCRLVSDILLGLDDKATTDRKSGVDLEEISKEFCSLYELKIVCEKFTCCKFWKKHGRGPYAISDVDESNGNLTIKDAINNSFTPYP